MPHRSSTLLIGLALCKVSCFQIWPLLSNHWRHCSKIEQKLEHTLWQGWEKMEFLKDAVWQLKILFWSNGQ